MINIKPLVKKKLETIPDVKVNYFYPKSWSKLPVISYYEMNNSEAMGADDEEYSSNIAIQVDIWAKSSSVCSNLAMDVDTKMRELVFHRTLALDLYESDNDIYHKTMRFEKEEIIG